LFDSIIFNTLIGNHDAHAKNFSLLYASKIPTLAPLYDTLSTAIYPNLTSKLAMEIGSKYKFSEVQARHWDQFAQCAGLSVVQARKRIIELAQQIPLAARKLAATTDSEFSHHPLIEKIIPLITQRCTLTIRRLTNGESRDM
jgi:serine/threonine-protein kinase HipA